MRQLTARQLQRRDAAADWTAENPVLLDGEIGYESDTGRFKFGDGATAWGALPYRGGVATVNGAQPDGSGDVQVATGGAEVRLVIRTQEEFDAMIASPTWLDAHSVLLAGAFTYTRLDGVGLRIPETVCVIEGVGGAEVCADCDVDAVLGYPELPIDGLHRMTGITVTCTGTGNGFLSIANMSCCTSIDCATGYAGCENLVNCTAQPIVLGFDACHSLTNCSVSISRATTAQCFSACVRLTNCTASIGRGLYGTGFDSCTFLCNCRADLSTTSQCIAYRNCDYCSCCTTGTLSATGVIWSGGTHRCDASCKV